MIRLLLPIVLALSGCAKKDKQPPTATVFLSTNISSIVVVSNTFFPAIKEKGTKQ